MPMVMPDSPPGHSPGWSRSSKRKMRSRALSLIGPMASGEDRGRFALDGAFYARLEGPCQQWKLPLDDHLALGDFYRAAGFEALRRAGEHQPVALPLVAGFAEVVPVLREELSDALVDLA